MVQWDLRSLDTLGPLVATLGFLNRVVSSASNYYDTIDNIYRTYYL